jgi:hypothetical protein
MMPDFRRLMPSFRPAARGARCNDQPFEIDA